MIDSWCITPLGGGMLGSHMASYVIENIAAHSLSAFPPRGMFHSSLWAQETCCDCFDRRKSAEVVDRGPQGWPKSCMTAIEFSPSSLFRSYYKAGVPWDLQPERSYWKKWGGPGCGSLPALLLDTWRNEPTPGLTWWQPQAKPKWNVFTGMASSASQAGRPVALNCCLGLVHWQRKKESGTHIPTKVWKQWIFVSL